MLVRAKDPLTKLQLVIIVLVLFFSSFVLPAKVAGAETIGPGTAYSHASLRAMARVYMASGSYDKAEPFLESALDLAKSTNAPDADVCACSLDLAYLYKNQGKLAEAEMMCLTGLELQKGVYGPKHPYVALTLRILGDIYRRQGRFREATACLEQALTIMRAVENEDDPAMAPFKVDMARLLVAKGDLAKAESCFDEALAVIEGSYGPRHLYTTRVLTSMATLYVLQGRHDEAEQFISRALPIQEKMYGTNHHFLVPAWLTMSRIHQARGDLALAKALLAKALRVAEGQSDSGRVLPVLETQVQLAQKSGDTKQSAKLQRRIDKIRAGRQYAYAPVARAIQ
jgi:tetratricopeptide (TPR) repeat protein